MQKSRVPEIPEGLQWFNVESPLNLLDQTGRVLLLDFGNYSSIRCLHVLADLGYLANRYKDNLVIVGIHSPGFPGEKSCAHVQKAINRNQLLYPVVHDPELVLGEVYGIREWPTQILVDREGYILGSLAGDDRLPRLEQIIDYQLSRNARVSVGATEPLTITPVPESEAVLSFPGKIVVTDSKIYIADSGNNRILVASKKGSVLRQYGGGAAGFNDGNATSAAFNNPQGMVLIDQYLYVADEGNHAIRRIHIRNHEVITVAGTGKKGSSTVIKDANPLRNDLCSPCDLAFRGGVLYIAMAGLHQVWQLSLIKNRLEVFSGTGKEGSLDGPPGEATFSQPSALTLMGNSLYTADARTSAIRRIDLATGFTRTICGGGLGEYGDADGALGAARFQYPLDITADPARNLLWVADTYNNKIRRISINDKSVSSVVQKQSLDEPGGLAFHNDTLYIANTNAHQILRFTPENSYVEALNVTEEFAEF